MKNKVLKLCKRLNKVTIDELLPILMATEGEIKPIIEELVIDGLLDNRVDGVYFYKEKQQQNERLPLFFECRTKEELNLIIRCFCIGLPTIKTGYVVNIDDNVIGKFFHYFRKRIYELQLEKLKELYSKKPQIARTRAYFDKSVYYYHYDKQTWVVAKPFNTTKDEKSMSKKDITEFKIDCSRIARRLFLNQRANYLEYHIAEIIWRLNNPNPDELVDYIYAMI